MLLHSDLDSDPQIPELNVRIPANLRAMHPGGVPMGDGYANAPPPQSPAPSSLSFHTAPRHWGSLAPGMATHSHSSLVSSQPLEHSKIENASIIAQSFPWIAPLQPKQHNRFFFERQGGLYAWCELEKKKKKRPNGSQYYLHTDPSPPSWRLIVLFSRCSHWL